MIEFYCMEYRVEVSESFAIIGSLYFTVNNKDNDVLFCGYRTTLEQCLSAATEAIAKHYAGQEVEAYSSKPKERIE